MSDAHLRALERRFRETREAADEAEWLRERVRVGQLAPEALEAAAYLGHPAALLALGRQAELHAREGRIEDVGYMLYPEVDTWLDRAGVGWPAEVIQIERVHHAVSQALKGGPGVPTLDRLAAELLDLLLGQPLGGEFVAKWRTLAPKLRPVRLCSWLGSCGSGTWVRLDTVGGRATYRARLEVERREVGLASFRDRLERLRRGKDRFGFDELEPPVSPERVAALEARCEVRLPEEYRAFLLQVGAGGGGPSRVLSPEEVLTLLPPSHDPSAAFPWSGLASSPSPLAEFPHGSIPVACAGHAGNVWTLLVTSGPERGEVWTGTRGLISGQGEPLRPLTRGDLVNGAIAPSSLPLGEESDPTRLTFERWYGEWLALYSAALELCTS